MAGPRSISGVLVLAFCLTTVRAAELLNVPSNPASFDVENGNRLFHVARFEEARAAYTKALETDPASVAAHLGLARIDELLSDSRSAATHYSAAYRIAPRNPDVVLAFAGVVQDPKAKQTLLENFLDLTRDARSADVASQLEIHKALAGGHPGRLLGETASAHIPLMPVLSGGLALRARVNGQTDLRLIVDTGAHGVILNRSAASRVGLQFLSTTQLTGYGSESAAVVHRAIATTFETGGLTFADLPVEASQKDITNEADGIAGLDLFVDFLIRFDPRNRSIDLTRLDDASSLRACRDCVKAYRLGHLLLVGARVNGSDAGMFILDTGAAHTVVSDSLVPLQGAPGAIQGLQGTQRAVFPTRPVTIRVGREELMDFHYALIDTSAISARNGIPVAGAIGYSLLRGLTLTIDYRSGMVQFSRARRN